MIGANAKLAVFTGNDSVPDRFGYEFLFGGNQFELDGLRRRFCCLCLRHYYAASIAIFLALATASSILPTMQVRASGT